MSYTNAAYITVNIRVILDDFIDRVLVELNTFLTTCADNVVAHA